MYKEFAEIYDIYMENENQIWADKIVQIWDIFGQNINTVLDLGCGTGALTSLLYKKGYKIMGIDNSIDMLMIAQNNNPDILFLNQDIRDFDIYNKVDSIISTSDVFNYILSLDELKKVFNKANIFLNPKGLFIFDINTKYKFENLGNENYSDIREDSAFIWENFYDNKKKENKYILNIFTKIEDNIYEKNEEIHIQKAYEISEIKSLLEETGFIVKDILDGYGNNKINEKSERALFIAIKP